MSRVCALTPTNVGPPLMPGTPLACIVMFNVDVFEVYKDVFVKKKR